MFIDEADIDVRGGRGGDGCVSFRREKQRPRGGPDGGDGGRGGSVLLEATNEKTTLYELHRKRHYNASNGARGGPQNRTGARGDDLVVFVPTGTVVTDEKGNTVADLVEPGQVMNVAPGGRGGRGNAALASESRPLPGFSENGEPGVFMRIHLELKLIADVAIVGFPNAGKSSLIARISGARPKIADYPFTTTEPNLGVVFGEDLDYVMTDVPGLVKGAHKGKGMGTAFLRHIERAAIIVYMLDMSPASGMAPAEELACLEEELTAYNPEFADRSRLAAANKMDLNPGAERVHEIEMECEERNLSLFLISAVTGEGVKDLLREVEHLVRLAREKRTISGPSIEYRPEAYDDGVDILEVKRVEGRFLVRGKRVERMVLMTDWNSDEALDHLVRRLRSAGVEDLLKREGARPGDEVEIASRIFEYIPETSEGIDEP